jgi:hypothetical protein
LQDCSTDFEFLPIDVSLGRCQRYFELIVNGANQSICTGSSYFDTNAYGVYKMTQFMRASPSLVQVLVTDGYEYGDGSQRPFDSFQLNITSPRIVRLNNNDNITTVVGRAGFIQANSASCFLALSAEL